MQGVYRTPDAFQLKTRYHMDYPRVLIKVDSDVQQLLYMIKEYESILSNRKITNDDIVVILCAAYQKTHKLNFWHPERPQYIRVAELIDIE